MLPAVGVLRTVPCPYYVAGLCDRPHCFFSHAKRDITAVLNNALNKGTDIWTEPAVPDSQGEVKVTKVESQESSSLQPLELANEKTSNERSLPENSPLVGDQAEVVNALKRRNSGDITGSEHKRQRLGSTELENSKMAAKCDATATSKEIKSAIKLSSGLGNFVRLDKEFLDSSENPWTIVGSKNDKRSSSRSKGESETQNRNSSKDKSSRKDSRLKNKSSPTDTGDKDKRSSSSSKHDSKSSRHHRGHSSSSKSNHQSRDSGSKQKTGSNTTSTSSSRHRHHKSSKHKDRRTSTNSSAHASNVTGIVNTDQNKSNNNDPNQQQDDSPLGNEFLFPEDNVSDDDDPNEIALECLEMFNSYKADESRKPKSENNAGSILPAAEVSLPPQSTPGKKRVAHPGAELHSAGPPTSAKPKLSYAEALQQRLHKVQEKNVVQPPAKPSNAICVHPQATSSNHQGITGKPPSSFVNLQAVSEHSPAISANSQPVSIGRKRISHVANVAGLLKPNIPATNGNSSKPVEPVISAKVPVSPTVVQTAQKGQNRVAHSGAQLPAGNASVGSPLISVHSVSTSKVPSQVRQKMLDQIFAECLEIWSDPATATSKALTEELNLVARCSSKPVYVCAGKNTIARLRREARLGSKVNEDESECTPVPTISHQQILAGSSGSRVSWSIESPKKSQPTISGTSLYRQMKKYILTRAELENNGYPLPDPSEEKGKAIAKPRTLGRPAPVSGKVNDKFDRTCDRCKKNYRVNEEGFQILEDQCVYHQGRKYSRRVNGVVEGFYNCCSGDASASGCAFAPCHVTGSLSTCGELRGFVTAVNCSGTDDTMGDDSWDIVAIDCEMIYTTIGPELARATFIGSDSQVLYDELVKPIHPIVDYNTRFSGITEEMLNETNTRLTDVQASVLTHLKPNSILIGHSLESDLIALKLMHHNIIDTSVMFPHKMGPPYKRALRNLSSEIIKKIIQEGEGGHDSAEDARTAMELVLWKLNEDLKIQDSKYTFVGRRRV